MLKNNDIDFSTLDSVEKIKNCILNLQNELQLLKLNITFESNNSTNKMKKIRKNIARLLTKLNSF